MAQLPTIKIPSSVDILCGNLKVSGRALNGWSVELDGNKLPRVRTLTLKLDTDCVPIVELTFFPSETGHVES